MKNKQFKIIGLDLDDVLLDFCDTLHSYHNNLYYGTSHKRGQVKSPDLEAVWSCSEEEKKKRVFDFYRSPEHWNAPPVIGSVKGVRRLKERHSLFVILPGYILGMR